MGRCGGPAGLYIFQSSQLGIASEDGRNCKQTTLFASARGARTPRTDAISTSETPRRCSRPRASRRVEGLGVAATLDERPDFWRIDFAKRPRLQPSFGEQQREIQIRPEAGAGSERRDQALEFCRERMRAEEMVEQDDVPADSTDSTHLANTASCKRKANLAYRRSMRLPSTVAMKSGREAVELSLISKARHRRSSRSQE
jgi:hypothetical protein